MNKLCSFKIKLSSCSSPGKKYAEWEHYKLYIYFASIIYVAW